MTCIFTYLNLIWGILNYLKTIAFKDKKMEYYYENLKKYYHFYDPFNTNNFSRYHPC